MITLESSVRYSRLEVYLERAKNIFKLGVFDKYGNIGVERLAAATPKDTGTTSESWKYKVKAEDTSISLEFYNSNVNKGVPIAIILQYGHGTGTGGWVEGVDYINPALKPIFEDILEGITKELRAI